MKDQRIPDEKISNQMVHKEKIFRRIDALNKNGGYKWEKLQS